MKNLYIKDYKVEIYRVPRESVGRVLGEILGNVYISWMSCGFVVNHIYQCGMGSKCNYQLQVF